MREMHSLTRATGLLHRFALASEFLGLYGSLRVVLLRQLQVPAADRAFYYRGSADAGVVCHLYNRSYRIVTPEHD